MINDLLSSDLALRLGWTLLHSLWQILLIWAVIGALLVLLARRSANVRYLVACCGMAAMYLPLIVTFLLVPSRQVTNVAAETILTTEVPHPLPVEQPSIAPREPAVATATSSSPAVHVAEPVEIPDLTVPVNVPSSRLKLAEVMSPWLPWIVGMWLIGVFLLALWNTGGWVVVQRLRNRAIQPMAQNAQQRLAQFAERLRISRPVRLVESLLVETPTVIGWLKPVILLPANLVTGLSPAELDAILAHELAHIVRHDYLVNLLQTITETMLFYHPAVWILSRRIRIEREFCCDDTAIEVCGNKTGYVRALAAIEQGRAAPVPAMSFWGRDTNMTLNRIHRILGHSSNPRHSWLAGGLLLPLLMFAIAGTVLIQTGLLAAPDDSASGAASQDVRGDTPRQRGHETKRSDGEPSRHELDGEMVDLKQFRLILTYHGETDKPWYNLTLSVPPLAVRKSPTNLFVPISESQAAPIARWLSASGFFKHARVTETQDDPTTGPQYLLRVRIGDKHYEETLGWDIGTLTRLDWLRKTLDGEAAKSMDQLLNRLAGRRKIWESGEIIDGLQTMLLAETNSFAAGRPALVKVYIKNVSQEDRQYLQHSLSGADFSVTDGNGRPLPLLGGYGGRAAMPVTIKPDETKLLGEVDLSTDHYLRRPGRYTASFRGYRKPPSNSFAFSVTPNVAGDEDGDPAGRLLPLNSAQWTLVGSPNGARNIRPGSNRPEVPGWLFQFVDPAKGIKGSKAVVWLWLTNVEAGEVTPDANVYLPVSEALGKVSRWNAYMQASPEALVLWPSVKEDLKKALNQEMRAVNSGTADAAASDDDYRDLHDRYKSLILVAAKAGQADEVSRLTDQFDASIGGKLLYVQVTPRHGPIANHEVLFSRFFDPARRISIGKLNFAVSDKPIVQENLHGQGCVLIATNPLGDNKWPDDLQVMILMDPVSKGHTETKGGATKPAKAPQWGEVKDGLRARLAAAKQSFEAGEPIPMTLEVENAGQDVTDYPISVTPAEDSVVVVDEQGQTVHQLSPLYQVNIGPTRFENLKPGEALKLASFDLSESYYLRKPGRYTASWPGKPASASFEFEVSPNPARAAADGDPVGRLLPLMKKGWWLGAGPRGAKFQPGRNWSEGTGRIVTFVHNPPSYRKDAGHIWLNLMDEALAALPPNTHSSKPEAQYLGKVARWYVYYVASESALGAWPTAFEDIKQALSATPKVSLKVESAHARYLPGEDVVVMVTIGNPGPANIEAPATYWSARMILDGKEYGRLPKFIGNWNGPGVIIPSGSYRGGITLAEYGVEPSSIGPGDHKLSLRIGDETSNELAFSIRAEKPKLSIKIATEHTAVAGADDIRLEVTLKNLDTERISLPWVYGATRVILDGKEKGPLGFAIDRGPAAIEPNGEFRTSQSLALGTLAQGDHTIALQIGDAQSNKLALTVRGSDAADVAPASGQVQAPLAPRYGVQRIDPSMLENKTWLELKKKLETSGMQYRWVEVNEKGECRLDLSVTSTSDLSPLKGAPITYLDASHTAVRDLSPLAGMPLTVLDLSGSQVQDLSPLKGMRLTMLRISGTRVKDLSPLTEAKLIQLTATSTAIADLSPLAEMPLDYLDIRSTAVTDLAPLVKTPLSVLQIEGCKVKDLTPLRNTPVRTLTLTGFDGLDLSQLQGTRLTRMTLSGKEIKDLAPLHGMKFESLSIVETGVKDISALAGMPLTELDLRDSPVADLSPLKGMRLVSVYLSEPGADLAPLAGMPLELISLPRGADVKNIDVVRAMKTLKWIRTVEIGKPIPAADFWRMYDAGELKGQKAVSQDATTVLPRADQANQDMVPAAGLETEVIRVLRLDSTLECDLNGICKNVAHRPRHGILSPDGKRIVYEHQDNDMVQLFVAQADGTQQRKLTKQNGKEYSPSWSADSERIAFVSDSPEKLQIHAINVDGSNHEQLTAHDQGAGLPKFGRDVSLAYLMWRQPLGKGRLSDLVVMQGKESKTIVTNQRVDDFAWSLDGRSLAIGKDGELVFHEIETGLDKSITFKEVNKGLDYHAARCITWNPAGDAIVCRIEATGGRKAGGPVLAGDEDVFIIPREGKPRAFSIGKTQADTPPKAGDSPHSLLVMELQWVRRSSNPATSALGAAQ